MPPTPLRFLAAGGIAALANIASRWVLDHWMPFAAAIMLAYGIGMIVAYTLMRRFVFGASGTSRSQEFGRFALVNAAALAQTLLVSYFLRWLIGAVGPSWAVTWRDDLAHLVGVAVPIVTSYIAHRHFTFRRRGSLPS